MYLIFGGFIVEIYILQCILFRNFGKKRLPLHQVHCQISCIYMCMHINKYIQKCAFKVKSMLLKTVWKVFFDQTLCMLNIPSNIFIVFYRLQTFSRDGCLFSVRRNRLSRSFCKSVISSCRSDTADVLIRHRLRVRSRCNSWTLYLSFSIRWQKS